MSGIEEVHKDSCIYENKYDSCDAHVFKILPVNPPGPFALFVFTIKNSFLVSFSLITKLTFSSILLSAIYMQKPIVSKRSRNWFNSIKSKFDGRGDFGFKYPVIFLIPLHVSFILFCLKRLSIFFFIDKFPYKC